MRNIDGIRKKSTRSAWREEENPHILPLAKENAPPRDNPKIIIPVDIAKEDYQKPPVSDKPISNGKKVWRAGTGLSQKNLIIVFLIALLLFGGKTAFSSGEKKAIALKREMGTKIAIIENKISKVQKEAASGNISNAVNDLTNLKTDILELKMFAQSWGQDIKYFQILNANTELTKNEKLLSTAYEAIMIIDSLPVDMKKLESTSYLSQGDSIADIKAFRLELSRVIDKFDSFAVRARDNLQGISYTKSLLPKIDQLINKINYAKKIANNDLFWLSGEDGTDKNILVIFQNNRELRGGSGGSFGSFGVARIKGGKLQKIDFGTNIYKLDKAFMEKEQIASPSELEAFGGIWSLKHSGFAVDGAEALDKIRWFYEKETGEKVDGAVTIDTDTIVSLLRVTGPIDMPAYQKTLNADNFVDETMAEVQNDYFERTGGKVENEPKKIIGDMTPIFITKLTAALNDKQKSLEIVNSLKQSFAQKHILFNFAKEDLQKEMVGLNLAGTVKNSIGDYLYINNSNLAGAKTNQNMVENVILNSEISKDGKITNNLSLERVHTGKSKAPDGLDRNYVRILIPSDSKVLSFNAKKGNFQRYYDRGFRNSQPFWTDKEAGKSSINFWMSTLPQNSTQAEMSYEPNYHLDLTKSFTYIMNFQRQPGAPADNIELNLSYPEGFQPINVDNLGQLDSKIKLKFKVDTDKEIKIKFIKTTK